RTRAREQRSVGALSVATQNGDVKKALDKQDGVQENLAISGIEKESVDERRLSWHRRAIYAVTPTKLTDYSNSRDNLFHVFLAPARSGLQPVPFETYHHVT
ncbi:unnamed protein product, partial [Ectocarpus fasciculatus]